jgi:hypothetical protein
MRMTMTTSFPRPGLESLDASGLRVRRAAAKAAVSAGTGTGDILPGWIYGLAGKPVPEGATDEVQRNPDRDGYGWT